MNKANFESLVQFGTLKKENNQCEISISLDPTHEVFRGHFPQQPVVPGVVTMEILRRALAMAVGQEIRLQRAANIKFLRMIDPTVTPDLQLNFEYQPEDEGWKVKASLTAKDSDDVMFKQQATFHA